MATSEEYGVKALLRSKLNSDQVKLWLPPFTTENGERGEISQTILHEYAKDLKITPDEVGELLEQLRVHSLERLAARQRFQSNGIATLRVKLPSVGNCVPSKKIVNVDISLKATGEDLHKLIANVCNLGNSTFRLIVAGKFVADDKTLEEQKITVNTQVMAVVTSSSVVETSSLVAEQCKHVNKTRADAELLAAHSELDENSLIEIADQTGRPLPMPREDRKALTLAMLLNEKGKAAIKRKEYPNALLLLMEADREFKKCSSDILNVVDNYALLCLDITWCYLCLKNIEDLPDADQRLQTCQDLLHRSYGQNLERLTAVKGNTANEAALLMRLHLLQGINCYHKKQWQESSRLLKMAEDELRRLKVDDEKLAQVMSLGYSSSEGRLGLRSSLGDLDGAVNFILQRRRDKLEVEKDVSKERQLRKRSEKLGRTINGELINANFYDQLVSMGYPGPSTREALRQSNNNVSMAVQILIEQPHLLTVVDNKEPYMGAISEEMISQVASFGFDPEVCKKCLEKHFGDVQRAVDYLLQTGGFFLDEVQDGASSSSAGKAGIDRKAMKAYSRLTEDISDDQEAHLDLTLEEEEAFLQEYKVLLWHAL